MQTITELELFQKRARYFNDVIGALAFALGLGALGTDAPRFYGTLAFTAVSRAKCNTRWLLN